MLRFLAYSALVLCCLLPGTAAWVCGEDVGFNLTYFAYNDVVAVFPDRNVYADLCYNVSLFNWYLPLTYVKATVCTQNQGIPVGCGGSDIGSANPLRHESYGASSLPFFSLINSSDPLQGVLWSSYPVYNYGNWQWQLNITLLCDVSAVVPWTDQLGMDSTQWTRLTRFRLYTNLVCAGNRLSDSSSPPSANTCVQNVTAAIHAARLVKFNYVGEVSASRFVRLQGTLLVTADSTVAQVNAQYEDVTNGVPTASYHVTALSATSPSVIDASMTAFPVAAAGSQLCVVVNGQDVCIAGYPATIQGFSATIAHSVFVLEV